MWVDPDFVWDVYSFLTHMREQDNDYLRKEIEGLKNRRVPDEDEQQWFYVLAHKIDDITVYLKSIFRLMSDEVKLMNELKEKGLQVIYCANNLPNGRTFRSMAHEPLADICEKYGGSTERRHYFTIPLNKWMNQKKEILTSIRFQLKQVRIDRGWRIDLDDLNKE